MCLSIVGTKGAKRQKHKDVHQEESDLVEKYLKARILKNQASLGCSKAEDTAKDRTNPRCPKREKMAL
jgi:hypothetical protein